MDSPREQLLKAQQELETMVKMTIADGAYRIVLRYKLLALIVPERVLFLTDGNKLTPEGLLLVQQLGAFLKTAPFGTIRIVGHDDQRVMRGSSKHSVQQQDVSNTGTKDLMRAKARATAIAQGLEEHGVDTTKLSPEWYANLRLIGADEPDVGYQSNRRVEIILEL